MVRSCDAMVALSTTTAPGQILFTKNSERLTWNGTSPRWGGWRGRCSGRWRSREARPRAGAEAVQPPQRRPSSLAESRTRAEGGSEVSRIAVIGNAGGGKSTLCRLLRRRWAFVSTRWWSIKRQIACLFRPRPDGPEGCPLPAVTGRLLRLIWFIHHHVRPNLIRQVQAFRDDKQVFHLRSPLDLRQFVRTYC